MKWHVAAIATLGAALLLAGCATERQARQGSTTDRVTPARLAGVHGAAGAPVSSFDVGNMVAAPRIYAWQSLSDRELLVYTRPRTAWLLRVGPCPRLFDTPFVALTTSMNRVDRFSKVLVFRSRVPCAIESIRPVDVGRLQVAMSHRPGASVVPRHGERWAGAARAR